MSIYDKLPIFPLSLVLFPYVSLPLHIFEDRYRAMVADCLERDAPFGIALSEQDSEPDGLAMTSLHTTGTLARIEQAEKLPDGRYNITIRGESRFLIQEVYHDQPYLTASVRPVWDTTDDALDLQPLFDMAAELFREYIGILYRHSAFTTLQMPQDAAFLSYAIAAVLQIDLSEKQLLLATDSPKSRLEQSIELLKREIASAQSEEADLPTESDPETENSRTISLLDSSYRNKYFSRS